MNSLIIALLWLSFPANGEQPTAHRTSGNPDLTLPAVSQKPYVGAGSGSTRRDFVNRRLLLEKLFLLNQKKKLMGIKNPAGKVKMLIQIINAELGVVERQLKREDSLRLDLANFF